MNSENKIKKCYDDCKYYRALYGGVPERYDDLWACHYMIDTGNKRESDPFECDKYERRIRRDL